MSDETDGTGGDCSEFSRRTMLGGIAGTVGVPFWLEFERDSLGTTGVRRDQTSGDSDEGLRAPIPPAPDDPFLITQYGDQYFTVPSVNGWVPVSHRERLRTIQRFHPDTVDWDSVMSFDEGDIRTYKSQNAQLAFSLETGLPGTVARNVTINIPNDDAAEKYQAVFDAYDWRFPDGTPVEHPKGLLAEQFDGTPHSIEYTFETNGVPSVFAPGAADILMYVARKKLSAGYSSFWIDGIGPFRVHGLDFSVWARDAFRTHLESLSADHRQELGIDDPASFDIRGHLRDEGLTPTDGSDPFEDPVFREYLLHQHQGIKEFFSTCRERLHELFPERMDAGDIKLTGNHYMGYFGHPQAANVYVSDYLDFVHLEHFPRVDPPIDYHYKLARAIGRFSKPTTAKGTLASQRAKLDGFDPEEQYPNFKRFQIAESYAMGARMKIPLTSGAAYRDEHTLTNWIRADGTVPERLQSFVDFLWTHERFLDDIDSDTRVAVVWSLPTVLWNHEPQWDVGQQGDSPRLESFVGTTTLLREAQIPYDVLVFGHPRLWDDGDQLERLREYDAVVLPNLDSVTDAQLTALETYLDDGGHVVTSGTPPSRDAMYEPRDDTATVFEHDRATVLSDDPGSVKNQRGKTTGELRDTLESADVQSVTDVDDQTLSVSRHVQSDPDRVVVHVLNYEYTVETDTFDTKTDVSLSIPKPDFTVEAARYYSPTGSTDLSVTVDRQKVGVTVPELTDWGFVVLVPSADALVNADAEANAREQIATVKNELATTKDEVREFADAFVSAEVYHDAAETALEANAYGKAFDAAQTASEKLSEAHRPPVVGIDMSHTQELTFDDDDPFAPLRDTFSQYDFRMLDSWSESELDELDILVVPPALAFRRAQFLFLEEEVEAAESFVEDGGSLLVLARGGVDDGIDVLTETFGFRFQGRPVVFPEGERRQVEPTHPDHLLTRGVSEITFQLGTPIAERPAESTVLASIPEDSDAWFHQERPLQSRSDAEGSAAGSDMYVTASHGDGRVTLFGMHSYHLLPDWLRNVEKVVSNQLSVLGSEAVRAKRSSQEATTTPNGTQSSTADPSQTDTTDSATQPATANSESATSTPGFSFTSGALTGVTALLTGWLWHRSDDDD
ncbi:MULTISPECIES: hypothetical protein [Haloferax]|uniref:Uncharacterized protein n=1 Tax=Haloferax marinum TaxID=2666143 RepID=A0A6A8G8W6_9EURY|nr:MULTISPECIES: hypothetical protein [Haloferax]KAB1197937.1 hypothetical protein Hfx1150_10570 [Haloferax sp. CBA1150]MRW97002.1 hypothetical protein [Haloferax marinum]